MDERILQAEIQKTRVENLQRVGANLQTSLRRKQKCLLSQLSNNFSQTAEKLANCIVRIGNVRFPRSGNRNRINRASIDRQPLTTGRPFTCSRINDARRINSDDYASTLNNVEPRSRYLISISGAR